jgi:hypothetical protein
MLFAAGMGIGLMFFGVLEPVYYFGTPWGDQPLMRDLGIVDGELADPATVEAARRMAMAGPSTTGACTPGRCMPSWRCRWRFSPTTRACR